MRSRIINKKEEIKGIIERCQVCHVSMVDNEGYPYVIPMNFGFEDDVVYLHSSRIGKKMDILKRNPSVCINFTTDHVLRYQDEQIACSWSMKYRSVLIYGKVEFIEDAAEKTAHLDRVMKQYTSKEFKYNPPSIREVCCWKVVVERFEGKAFGY